MRLTGFRRVGTNSCTRLSEFTAKTEMRSGPSHFLNSRSQFFTRLPGHTISARLTMGCPPYLPR